MMIHDTRYMMHDFSFIVYPASCIVHLVHWNPRILDSLNPFFVCINVSIFSDVLLIIILDLLEIICNTIFREVSEVFVVSSSKDSGLCSFPIT